MSSNDAVLTARLQQFYQTYAPEMVDNVPKVLQDFKYCISNGANELQLISHLEKKYKGKFPRADEVKEGLDALATTAHNQEHSGILYKKGRWLRQWKARHFQLHGTVLQMFIEKGDPVPRRVCTIGPGTKFEVSTARAHAFTLQLPGGENWTLAAPDAKSRSAWLTALGNSVVQQEKFQKSLRRFRQKHHNDGTPGSGAAASNEVSLDVAGTVAVLKHIEQHHLGTRKLFSALEASLDYVKSVDPQKLARLQAAMATGNEMVMSGLLPNCDAHLLAAALKGTLRAREHPLIPFGLYTAFVDAWRSATANGATPAQSVLVDALKPLCDKIPQSNKNVASLLLKVCSQLKGGESTHLLAYTFGPAFLRTEKPPTELKELLEGPKMVNAIVEFMIRQNAALYFNGAVNNDTSSGQADIGADDDDDDDVDFGSSDEDEDDEAASAPKAPPQRPKGSKPPLPPARPSGGESSSAASDLEQLQKERESLRHINRMSQRHMWKDLKAIEEAEDGIAALKIAEEAEAEAKAAEEERARAAAAEAEAEAKAKAEAEAKAKAEAEAKAKAEAEAQAKAEAEAKAKAEAEAKAAAKRKAEAEAKRKAEAAARKKAEEVRKAKEKAEAEARAKAHAEALAKAKTEAEKKRQAEAAAKAEAEAKAKAKAAEEAAKKAEAEAKAKAKAEAEAAAKAEAERKAKAEAERKAKAKAAAERKAKAEAERKAKAAAKKKAEEEKKKKEAAEKAKKAAAEKAKKEAAEKAEKEAAEKAKKETADTESGESAPAPAPAKKAGGKKKGRKKKTGIAAKWDAMAAKTQAEQKRNIFSKDYDANFTKKTALKRGDKGYGRAPEGSKSAARAKRAKAWVKEQMDMLLGVITRNGKPDKKRDGRTGIDFGSLFYIYQDISDTLVGMIRKSRKARFLDFEGDMLFQHAHGHVMITLTEKGEKRVVNKNLRELMPRSAPAANEDD